MFGENTYEKKLSVKRKSRKWILINDELSFYSKTLSTEGGGYHPPQGFIAGPLKWLFLLPNDCS